MRSKKFHTSVGATAMLDIPAKPVKSPGQFQTQAAALKEAVRIMGPRATAEMLPCFDFRSGTVRWEYLVGVIADYTATTIWSGASFVSWDEALSKIKNSYGQPWPSLSPHTLPAAAPRSKSGSRPARQG